LVEPLYQSLDQSAGEIKLGREHVKILKWFTCLQELFTTEEYITFAAAIGPEVEFEKDGFATVLPVQVERI
jgi:hypothetical protein